MMRYNLVNASLKFSEHGEWVRYEDAADIQKRLDVAIVALEAISVLISKGHGFYGHDSERVKIALKKARGQENQTIT